MSKHQSKICSLLIGETFGGTIQTVADVLFYKGPTSLRLLSTLSNLPLTSVQTALKILIQHSIISFQTNQATGDIIYSPVYQKAIELMRYPKYFVHAEKHTGSVSREVLEELVQTGLSPISRLIYICGFRVIKANPDVTEIVLLEQLVLFRDTLLRLAGHKYIIIVPPPKKDEEMEEEEEAVPKFLHMLPDVDLKLVMQKLLGKCEDNLEDFPDAKSMWGINVPQFHAEFRNIMVYKSLERKFKSMIDPRVIKVLIENGFDKYPWEPEGAPVSLPLLQDSIDKLSGGGSTIATSKFMSEHLEVLEDDPMKLVSNLSNAQGEHYSFNMKTAITELLWSTVDTIITEKHGFHALRIFRLVKENGFVEQDVINEMGMIPGKDAKHLTYKLVEDNYINIKELRKSYAANAQPGKICHVFYVNENQVVRALQDYCYKSIVNLQIKSKIERDKIKTLTLKEERITRILVNMTNKKCTEEQLNEIRELLTPPERSLLLRYQFQSGKLLSGAMQADETLFVTDIYMRYNAVKKVVKK